MERDSYLNELLQSMLDIVTTCLEEDSLTGAIGESYIYHGNPPADCCDAVVIWASGLAAIGTFPSPPIPARLTCDVGRMIEVKLRIVRPCWPVLKDSPTSPFPPSSESQAAAEALLIDANVIWCCLTNAAASGSLWPEGSMAMDFQWLGMVPDDPKGGCAGWTATMNVEVEPCC